MSPVNNDTVVSEFARYLKLKNFTAKTIEHRLGQIARLARWLGETSLLEATPEQLEAWQGSLRVCPSSIQTYTSQTPAVNLLIPDAFVRAAAIVCCLQRDAS
ncbi:hypothetical protein ACM0B6_07550, partial [Mycobacteroides abscessus subsp. abscessus]